MNISFIIASGPDKQYLPEIKHSIITECTSDYEIIILHDDCIEIDERRIEKQYKSGHITQKKNDGIKLARYDNLIIMHDYYKLCSDFCDYLDMFDHKMQRSWELMMTRIVHTDGVSRYHDWCNWDSPDIAKGKSWTQIEKWCPNGRLTLGQPCLIPYSISTKHWYIPGGFWIAKRFFMLRNLLDESLFWGDGEDVCFSLQVRDKARYVMNTSCTVQLCKLKTNILKDMSEL